MSEIKEMREKWLSRVVETFEKLTEERVHQATMPKSMRDKPSSNQPGSNSIVQQMPNRARVDVGLAAFIQANTGGTGSPYDWSNVQLGKVQPPAVDPNAGLNKITPASNGCVTAECAANVASVQSENRSIEQIDKDLKTGVCSPAGGKDK